MTSRSDFVAAALATCLPALSLLAMIGIWFSYRLVPDNETAQGFNSARGKAGTSRLFWGFLATSLGSWVFMRPGYYAAASGLVGLCMYAMSVGAPIVFVAMCGNRIMKSYSGYPSLSAYAGWRFSSLAEMQMAALIIFNTAVLVLAEYSSIISIFADYVDVTYVPVILCLGLGTLAYSIWGGLLSTLLLSRYQLSAFSGCMVGIAVYLAFDFRATPPEKLTNQQKGFNEAGLSTLAIFPLAIISSGIFNEGLWQRCWASSTSKSLALSSIFSSTAAMLLTASFGIISLLSQWTLPPPLSPPVLPAVLGPETDIHAYYSIFQTLRPSASPMQPTILKSWPGVVAVLAATVLSQCAAATLQSAITATVSSYAFPHQPLFMTRTFSFLLNGSLILLSLIRPSLPSLLHLTQMLCTAALLPFLLSLHSALQRCYHGDMFFYSNILTFLIASGYGTYCAWDPTRFFYSIQAGLAHIWYRDTYAWQPFLAVLLSSVVALAFCMLLGLMLRLVVRETDTKACFCLGDSVALVQKGLADHWDAPIRRASDPHMTKGKNTGLLPRALSNPFVETLARSLTRSKETMVQGSQALMEVIRQKGWAMSSSSESERLEAQNSDGSGRIPQLMEDASPKDALGQVGARRMGGRKERRDGKRKLDSSVLSDEETQVMTVGGLGVEPVSSLEPLDELTWRGKAAASGL